MKRPGTDVRRATALRPGYGRTDRDVLSSLARALRLVDGRGLPRLRGGMGKSTHAARSKGPRP